MTNKHPTIPASAPTTPAVTRKTDRHGPVTPQRISYSAQVRSVTSPYSPATNLSTPYTPFSLRSVSSSSNGSNLATPASAVGRRRLSLSLSPEVNFNSKSLADIAENWRTRANENGIKVTSGDDMQYEADVSSLDISMPMIDKALLPAPFLSSQRRARAFSQTQAPLSQITDPAQLCTPSRVIRQPTVLDTPPPQPGFGLRGSVTDPARLRRRPTFEQTDLFDIDENDYAPYPQAFVPVVANQSLPLSLTQHFNLQQDFSAISESAQLYEPSFYPTEPEEPEEATPFACSVCGDSGGTLAVLEPCAHPLCRQCLTSALNIVGEKDMECAVCKSKVDNFQLHKAPPTTGAIPGTSGAGKKRAAAFGPSGLSPHDNSILQGLCDATNRVRGNGGIGDYDDFMDRAQGSSTPVPGSRGGHRGTEESVVLRVDNVPWDITPPAIVTWLKHPVQRVHVLLDRKGKTLSHAYVEMANADGAKAALRSAQNSVLGRGKRARGVTVTKSSQEELMKALFPSWQGNFDGCRPSLSGLDNERVISTLQRGLISEAELNSLLHLIRSPDSHFLKVPSLPFHSLISILSKFPSDDDSRVFWPSTLRDKLYEITYSAVQVLLVRNEDNPLSDWAALITQVVRAAMDCQAFTSDQMSKLSDILEDALPKSTSSPPGPRSRSESPMDLQSEVEEAMRPAENENRGIPSPGRGTYGDLAQEFGVEPHLVEALARRLSAIR
ncbi:uncharacterized protein C8Q71DRAFT_861894 [Rhodofomes roseus]|uniref:RING-type domain-containing protein n=1 Tax=Rhodofomes roseus TaxID=34475 RepID=A0ABQ8K3G4_9APHY|nr:uncharacterized protein C8Q71DRAFT_861894 [Rhodofomes roseus]KAH9831159.1 hypothetical protein C8Q71DRAFT_861894 [Rhodofomes roseus]